MAGRFPRVVSVTAATIQGAHHRLSADRHRQHCTQADRAEHEACSISGCATISSYTRSLFESNIDALMTTNPRHHH